jgi:hypothetical protein
LSYGDAAKFASLGLARANPAWATYAAQAVLSRQS